MNEAAWMGARQFAKKYKFSFLKLEHDLLAQAQNTAIRLHPDAKWIFKIDEDILLSDNYFAKMKRAYSNALKDLYYPVSFLSPLINLNAGGFRRFLETIDKWGEFKEKFPSRYYFNLCSLSPEIDIIHQNTEAAKYIWKNSIPFDKVAKKIEERNQHKYSVCPIRMSIGAILFTREKWEEWGYFDVKGVGEMGAEERQVCAYSINSMQTIIIVEDVFVGHLGFYTQKETCHQFFDEHIKEIHHRS